MTHNDLIAEAHHHLELLQDLRRKLHQIPEFGLQTPKSLEKVLSAVEGKGEIHRGTETTWGVVHIKGEHPGPTVLLRADMDALAVVEDTGLPFASTNGYMHACGHDLHMAIGVGATHLLANHRDRLKGDVIVFFQPGEEGHNGAGRMIEDKAHLISGSKPIAAYGIHVFSGLAPRGLFLTKPGPMMASAGDMIVTVHGRAGHGSSPWLSKEPISVMTEIMSSLQTMVTKKFSIFDPVVINVGWVKAGDPHTTNVIPEEASFGATLRTFSNENTEGLRTAAKLLAESIAAGYGLTVDVEFSEHTAVVINSEDAAARVERVTKAAFGEDRFMTLPNPMAGAEDFAEILNEVGGSFIFLGATMPGVDFHTADFNHSNRAMFDDSVIADGAALLALLAIDTLDEAAAK